MDNGAAKLQSHANKPNQEYDANNLQQQRRHHSDTSADNTDDCHPGLVKQLVNNRENQLGQQVIRNNRTQNLRCHHDRICDNAGDGLERAHHSQRNRCDKMQAPAQILHQDTKSVHNAQNGVHRKGQDRHDEHQKRTKTRTRQIYRVMEPAAGVGRRPLRRIHGQLTGTEPRVEIIVNRKRGRLPRHIIHAVPAIGAKRRPR